jgi:nitrate reductase molybdenum cofactor assembly chaperone NarJ/NarW
MKLLNLLSLLLDYPEDNSPALIAELKKTVSLIHIPEQTQQQLCYFLDHLAKHSLLDLQSDYDGLFERGRALSLHLFEHVHGESRDRGQAMVNLQQQYKAAGLDINAKELPDYLPLYLEFLSTQGEENARIGLEEVAPILALLCCRLEKRESAYAGLFHCLIWLSDSQVDLNELRKQMEQEKPDNTPEALDKVWEEEVVDFSAEKNASSCGNITAHPSTTQSRSHIEFLTIHESLNLQTKA